MGRLEKRLFYFLLDRWASQSAFTLGLRNGIVCLTKNHHLQIKNWEQTAHPIKHPSKTNDGGTE